MRLKNVPKNIPRYGRRVCLYYRNSRPFLSGDLFADEADINVYPQFLRGFQPSIKSVAAAQVIFCPSHHLERFLEDYAGSIHAKILILGNSDRDFVNMNFQIPSSIRAVFAQNLFGENERFRILPIGIENLRLGTNGLKGYFDQEFAQTAKTKSLIVGPFSFTHPERNFVRNFNNPNVDEITFLESRLKPREYANKSAHFKYVAAPRGNGLDTHRFWEALYRGSSPVVLQSDWASALKNYGLPIVEIEDWSNDSLIRLTERPFGAFNPSQLPFLWWAYWRNLINSLI